MSNPSGGDAFDAPMQARARNVDSDTSELRGECPRSILNSLDAAAIARNKSRMFIANEILSEWAKKRRHELTVLQRLDGINPTDPEGDGGLPS